MFRIPPNTKNRQVFVDTHDLLKLVEVYHTWRDSRSTHLSCILKGHEANVVFRIRLAPEPGYPSVYRASYFVCEACQACTLNGVYDENPEWYDV